MNERDAGMASAETKEEAFERRKEVPSGPPTAVGSWEIATAD